MKKNPRNAARFLSALVLASAFAATIVHGQSRDPRVVKAVAGGINFVSGDVKLQETGQSGWQRLTLKDDLKSGDIVKSGSDGRAEILLNPGSYLRLGFNSEIELTDASLDTLSVKLFKGSAVIEAAGYEDMPLAIAVNTPQTTLLIVRRGIYRINITPANETEVAVKKGRAVVGKGQAAVVKSGNVARVGASGVALAKLDKKNLDALDLWSKERADELAKLNERLRRKEARTLLASTYLGRFNSGFGRYGGHGVWVYSATAGCYTFLPFYGSWNSGYGYSYGGYWSAPGCFSCNSNNGWDNPSYGTGPTAKSNPPIIYPSPDRVSNPIPVTRSSGSDGGFSPSTGGKVKP
jgi:hypothetical protein